MNLAERIKAAQDALIAKKDALVEATKTLEITPDDDGVLATVDQLSGEVEQMTKSLESLQRAEKALAARAQPINAPGIVHAGNLQKNAPKDHWDIFTKAAVVKMRAMAERKSEVQVLEEQYGELDYVKATFPLVTKTAVAPAMTTDAAWAGALVMDSVQGALLDSLKDVAVVPGLAARSISLNFGGANTIKVPHRNPFGASLTEPAFVGEGGAIPLTAFSFGSTTLNRYKLAAITTATMEILERSNPSLEALIRDGLREAYAEVVDAAVLSAAAAVTNVRPAGILNGVSLAAGTAGGGEDAVRGDILTALTAMTTARVGARPVLLINNLDRLAVSMMTTAMSDYLFRDELASGFLMGIPVIASANVAQHTMILVDAAGLAFAIDTPMMDVSTVATVVEANADGTAPTMAGTAAAKPGAVGTAGQVPVDGGIPVSGGAGAASTGYTSRSLWQTYSWGIRMIAPISWAVLRAGSVQGSDSTTWTA